MHAIFNAIGGMREEIMSNSKWGLYIMYIHVHVVYW